MAKSKGGLEWVTAIGKLALLVMPSLTLGCSAFSLDPPTRRDSANPVALSDAGGGANTQVTAPSPPNTSAATATVGPNDRTLIDGGSTTGGNGDGPDASSVQVVQTSAEGNSGQTFDYSEGTSDEHSESASTGNEPTTRTDDTSTSKRDVSSDTSSYGETKAETNDATSRDESPDVTGAAPSHDDTSDTTSPGETSDTPTSAPWDDECEESSDCNNTPLNDYCADDDTLVHFPSGFCNGGHCEYEGTEQNCEFGCSGSACLPDPCTGMECDAPPVNTCESGGLRTFDSQGTCKSGECDYVSHLVDCDCVDGECITDPCASVTCNSPPAATCNGTTYRTFEANGECNAGSCDYAHRDESCYACGAEGCYCPAGTEVSGGSCSGCEGSTYSATTNAESCTPHTQCGAGYYVSRFGTPTANQQCSECPDGKYNQATNASSCTPHTLCSAPYVEATPPSKTEDRTCMCPLDCGDGRCLAANQCCEPTEYNVAFSNSTLDTSVEHSFCLEMAARIRLTGGSSGGGPNPQPPTVWSKLYDAADNLLGAFTNGSSEVLVNVQPGTYRVTLSVSYGVNGGGGAVAIIEEP